MRSWNTIIFLAVFCFAGTLWAEPCGSLKVVGGSYCADLEVILERGACGMAPVFPKVKCENGVASVFHEDGDYTFKGQLNQKDGQWVEVKTPAPQKVSRKKKWRPKKRWRKPANQAKKSAPVVKQKPVVVQEVSKTPAPAAVAQTPTAAPNYPSWLDNIKLGGSARIRGEGKGNNDYNSDAGDNKNFIASRFRLDFTLSPDNEVDIFFQPQFTKTWGANEFVATGTSTVNDVNATPVTVPSGKSSSTSGALNDTGLDVHQAFVLYRPTSSAQFKMGRQEVAYGDHLVVGTVGWHNVARSFDAIKFRQSYWKGWSEVLYSKITENNATAAADGDKDFFGFYNSFNLGPAMKFFDLYYFHLVDTSTVNNAVSATGARMKSSIGNWSYRIEGTGERTKGKAEQQIDVELGAKIPGIKSQLFIEYFQASEGYNQLFPTAHKWLGYADFFKRQNIQGYRVGFKSQVTKKVSTHIDYHVFERHKTDTTAYDFGGNALGTTGTDKDIAQEVDLVVKFKVNKSSMLVIGGSTITPGEYIKKNKGKDAGAFGFVQWGSKF